MPDTTSLSTDPETPAPSPESGDVLPSSPLVWDEGNPFDQDSPFERRRTRWDEDFGQESLESLG